MSGEVGVWVSRTNVTVLDRKMSDIAKKISHNLGRSFRVIVPFVSEPSKAVILKSREWLGES